MPLILEMQRKIENNFQFVTTRKKHIESSMIKCEFATFERDAGIKLLTFTDSVKLLASLLVL